MTFEELREFKEFRNCEKESDFLEVADQLNKSREVYVEADECGIYFNTDCDDNGLYYAEGLITIEVGFRNIRVIHIPVNVVYENFNMDEGLFDMQTVSMCNVEEWY